MGLCDDDKVRYVDVKSDRKGFTMPGRLLSGPSAIIEPLLIIFYISDTIYSIRGVPDNITGVEYRTRQKLWMGVKKMTEWMNEPCVIKPLPMGRIRYLFVDAFSSHNLKEEVLCASEKIRTTMRYFPANTTKRKQSCDSLAIQL